MKTSIKTLLYSAGALALGVLMSVSDDNEFRLLGALYLIGGLGGLVVGIFMLFKEQTQDIILKVGYGILFASFFIYSLFTLSPYAILVGVVVMTIVYSMTSKNSD